MNLENLQKHIPQIEEKLHYRFGDRSLIVLAFLHKSYTNEYKEIPQHNERLEFLGDTVLGLLISEYLYKELPNTPEGELSYLRSRLVEAPTCTSFIHKLELEKYLLLGRGEKMNVGRGRNTILSDLFESILGAIYLDGGLDAAREFIFGNFLDEIKNIIATPEQNPKAILQDYCQKKHQTMPIYTVIQEVGPDHSKQFTISVQINEMEGGVGMGSSKKEAQQRAAAEALKKLGLL